MDEPPLTALAACPEGQAGVAVAELMGQINSTLCIRAASLIPESTELFEVLEVGFGAGGFRQALRTAHPQARWVGLEKSRTMVEIQRQLKRYEVEQGVVEHLPFEAGRFACVVALNTLCWWSEPCIAFAEIHRVLKPGGFCIVNVVIPNAVTKALEQGMAPKPTYYTPNMVAAMMKTAGLGVQVSIVEDETIEVDNTQTTRTYALMRGVRDDW